MKMKFHQRILILLVFMLLWSALVPFSASGQDSFVISEVKLINIEAEQAGDRFGYGVAVDGSTLMIGAPRDDEGASNSGSAYVFTYTDDSDFPQTKLTEDGDVQTADYFGNSLDISGDLLVIGAYKDDNGEAIDSGSAYVMKSVYDETNAGEQTKLTASEPSLGDEFGYSVAVSGNIVVVGAHKGDVLDGDDNLMTDAGCVYVFTYDGSAWVEEAKLMASDVRQGERFGSSVAIDGNTIVIGAIYGGESDFQTGSVYVFHHDGSAWVEEAKLIAADLGDRDKFGYSVAIDGDTIVAGAPYHDHAGEGNSGAAYVFRLSSTTWIEEAKLTGSELSADDRFGNSVSLSGNTAVVGAYKDDIFDLDNNVMEDSGSVCVFRFDGSGWAEEAKLIPSDAAEKDEFGHGVAISGTLVVIGAHKADAMEQDSGSAYVFTIAPENQPPVAVVGEDLEAEEGSLVTLVGSGSYDPDGDVLSYAWAQIGGPEVSLDDPNKADPTFTAPPCSSENETLTFQLIVSDGRADSLPAEVNVTIFQSTKSVTVINSVLGSKQRPWGIDKDIYTFQGTQGEQVTVTLRAKLAGKNNHGDRATLKLKDNIRGVRFFRIDSSRLPNQISATLPATGQYYVFVAGQPRFFRGRRFLGEYTLTLEGASGTLEKGAGSSLVHNDSPSSTKSHKRHPIWNWILRRFRH